MIKLKIAVIGHSLYPIKEPFAGGLEKFTHSLVEYLVEVGHSVTLLGHEESVTRAKLWPLPLNLYEYDLRDKAPEEFDRAENKAYCSAMSYIEDANFDIVHNNSLHHIPLIRSGSLSVPCMTTFHTPIFTNINFGLSNASKLSSQKWICVSESLAKAYRKHLSDINVIHNGIKVDDWHYSTTVKRKKAIWVGRICKEKAPVDAIVACRTAGFHLTIVGPISDNNYFNEEVEPLIDGNQIVYAGHLNHIECNKLYMRSEVALFTSHWEEPFGLVIIEALAAGTPVIAYNVGAASEIITQGVGYLVEKFDFLGLVRALNKIHHIQRQSCRDHIIRNFSFQHTMRAYEESYLKMCSSHIKENLAETISCSSKSTQSLIPTNTMLK